MIGSIPNPKKEIQIDRPVEEVKEAIEHLVLFTKKYMLTKENAVLNLFTFEAFELLSLGVYIDIHYSKVSDEKTSISIEIRRKLGSFDKSHEVTKANNHLVAIIDLLSQSLQEPIDQRRKKMAQLKKAIQKKEEELKNKKEEAIRKQKEQKVNNPTLYYSKQALLWLIAISLMAYAIYIFYKISKL